MFPCLGVPALYRQVWSPDRLDRIVCSTRILLHASFLPAPATTWQRRAVFGTAPARCATPVTTAESEILALFENKALAAFEDCANKEYCSAPAQLLLVILREQETVHRVSVLLGIRRGHSIGP